MTNPYHHDYFHDTPLGEHPFDAQLQKSLGVPASGFPLKEGADGVPASGLPLKGGADNDQWRRREARKHLVMAGICVGSILIGTMLGVGIFCDSLEIGDRLVLALYGERV
jgi:hypothetical protein